MSQLLANLTVERDLALTLHRAHRSATPQPVMLRNHCKF
jgi:hypothetical protein